MAGNSQDCENYPFRSINRTQNVRFFTVHSFVACGDILKLVVSNDYSQYANLFPVALMDDATCTGIFLPRGI